MRINPQTRSYSLIRNMYATRSHHDQLANKFYFFLFQLTLPNEDGDLVPIALASSDNYIPVPGLPLHTTVMISIALASSDNYIPVPGLLLHTTVMI